MNPEANPVYKVLRSLWFPMSVNAAVLGAAAVVVFRAVSLLAALALDYPGRPWEADSDFDDRLLALVVGGLPALGDLGSTPQLALFLVQSVTAYVLWAVFGVAMCRTLAVRIGRDEYIPMKAAWKFALSTKTTALLHFPAMALPILFCGAVVAILGLFVQIPYVGWVLNAVLLPGTVLFAVIMQIIWFAGIVALGFTPAAIASERRGIFETVPKVLHYLFARPLPTVLYLSVLFVFFWLLESAIFAPDRLKDALASLLTVFWHGETFDRVVRGDVAHLDGFAKFAGWLHLLMFGGIDALVRGAFLSWAAGGFTALFLMFRQECDGVDMADVVRE